jgi:hypothetical protein
VLGVLALASGFGFSSASRAALLSALERPATPAAGAAPRVVPGARLLHGRAVVRAGAYTATLRLVPNRASAANHVSLALAMRGRPLVGARVSITFGMPAMGMTDAYSSPLAARAAGGYAAAEPVLGMPGLWQLRLHVVPAHGAPFDLAVSDTLVG